MTEAEWMACGDPGPMLEFLRGKASDRKLRLFTCGSNRRNWDRLTVESRAMMQVAEEVADGLALKVKLSTAKGKHTRSAARGAGPSHVLENMFVREVAHKEAWGGAYRFACVFAVVDSAKHSNLLRDIFGNPFRPITLCSTWRTLNVASLAQTMYADRAFDRLPILADALEDAGCDNADILAHCREPGEHVRGCWVVDLLLGKS
jgi:hypothetical protein